MKYEGLGFDFFLTDSQADFEQIVTLNRLNNMERINRELWASDGFLTTEYDVDQLEKIRGTYKHVVAKYQGEVVGYALVLLKENRAVSPYPDPMFEFINATKLNDKLLKDLNYFVMTQICVEKKFRGMGVFRALYQKLAEQMRTGFEKVVIKVSSRNVKSMNAHQKIGFKVIENKDFSKELGDWNVMVWDLKSDS